MIKPCLTFDVYADRNSPVFETVSLTNSIIKIGSDSRSHIRLKNGAKMQAVIETAANESTLLDLGHEPGTRVNGVRVFKKVLAIGDLISLEESRIILRKIEEYSPPTPYGWLYCEHANECPQRCPCREGCICRKEGSCKPTQVSADSKPVVPSEDGVGPTQPELDSWVDGLPSKTPWRKLETEVLLKGRKRAYEALKSLEQRDNPEAGLFAVSCIKRIESVQEADISILARLIRLTMKHAPESTGSAVFDMKELSKDRLFDLFVDVVCRQ